jgi:formylglycine-generating enzyme required for sulfatase activity
MAENDLATQIAQLQQNIASLESLSPSPTIESALQSLRQELAGLDDPAAALSPQAALAAVELVGAAALEWSAIPPALQQELASFFTRGALLEGTPPVLRAAAGNTLARLGDLRTRVISVDAMEFCYIPAGPFMMGSLDEDKLANKSEKPLHEVNLPYGCWLGHYPVTVAQFQAFVEDSGYKPEDKIVWLICPIVQ